MAELKLTKELLETKRPLSEIRSGLLTRRHKLRPEAGPPVALIVSNDDFPIDLYDGDSMTIIVASDDKPTILRIVTTDSR
ncbi:MAG TPA: hypothetical protein VL866_24105 [Pyrinomonadaceae bacterium]|nr:hypothetical protein [Pyrinomonadaceae bacterium]